MLDSDRLFLRAAVELAARGRNSTTPNPAVGCLVVRGDEVLGRGWHIRAGEGHAEVNALADLAERHGAEAARGATVYVSLEPCAFAGRTPACTGALIDAGVGRVVAAMTDPHPKVAGAGFRALEEAGIEVEVEELPEAHALLEGYVSRITRGRPFVRIKVAVSLDGRTAMASGESQWITGPAAREDVQAWRARACAIVTGSETVLADDPAMNVRSQAAAVGGRIRQPLRVVLDSRGRVPKEARIFDPPGEVLVVLSTTASGAAEKKNAALRGEEGGSVLELDADERGRVSLPALFSALAERGINEVLVEAGPTLAGEVLRSGLWDELLVYQAPKLLGSEGRPLAGLPLERMEDAIEATMIDCVAVGDDLRLRFRP
jgi:diaminohydroxyphosphoribosylaminopyrimidine deaminase/5-amino-6-(5-phosphoribosylamino)uracil reductase